MLSRSAEPFRRRTSLSRWGRLRPALRWPSYRCSRTFQALWRCRQETAPPQSRRPLTGQIQAFYVYDERLAIPDVKVEMRHLRRPIGPASSLRFPGQSFSFQPLPIWRPRCAIRLRQLSRHHAVVFTKKAGPPAAEAAEQRAGTKGNADQQSTHRTQTRARVTQALSRVRQAARQRKKERFTALLHQVNVGTLQAAFYALKRKAAAGVDGVTWQDYEVNLERNLEDLC
jgi:hypothetical protein